MRKPAKVTAALVAIVLIAAGKHDEKTTIDKQRLQGTWEYVSATCNGKPYAVPIGARITFAEDSIIRVVDKNTYEHKYKLYPNKEPKEIALIALTDGKE